MIKFLKSLFVRVRKPDPVPGEHYRLDYKDPFNIVEVVVTDVKQGWVRYAFTYAPGYDINSMPIPRFHRIYTKVDSE